MEIRFKNRMDAGMFLARKLDHYAKQPDVVVLALPRGGVPVGFTIATYLRAPLDIFVVRNVPEHFEAVGAWYADFTETTIRRFGNCCG